MDRVEIAGRARMKPDASRHDPRPEYLRALIEKTGLSQHEVATRIGIGLRLLKYYLTTPDCGKESRIAPYPVQFAIESLARRARTERAGVICPPGNLGRTERP